MRRASDIALFVLRLVGYHYLRPKETGARDFVCPDLPLRSFGELLVLLPCEDASLHPTEAPEPPDGGGDPVDEQVLELRPIGELGPQVFVQLLQGVGVFTGQENLLREQTVPHRVQAVILA
jgi:hypothetical protein